MEMAANEIGKRLYFFRRLLHQEKIRLFSFDESSDVVYRSADPAQQIPANNLQFDLPRKQPLYLIK